MEDSYTDSSEKSNFMDLSLDDNENDNKNNNNSSLKKPPENFSRVNNLRSIQELPEKYQNIFEFPLFNLIQSHIFDDVMYTDEPVVISAPTGSGKTAVFELAIVRLMIKLEENLSNEPIKIIYVAPVKSLCSERLTDWYNKFAQIGLKSIVVTGDTDNINYKILQNYNIIITTPEKWDSMTRNSKENQKLVNEVKLFLIDEVHLLNEENRGPILEAIVSRMKIYKKKQFIRFVAVSATIPNVEDIAKWLGNENNSAIYYKIGEELRPVKLRKIVLGYSCDPRSSAFKFDVTLNYKIQSVLMQYSEGKPTLIFCSTRRGVELTAKHISQEITFHLTPQQKQILQNAAQKLIDNKMRSQLQCGVGCHHAGMSPENRILIENVFRDGQLPVLVTTSTLAIGVNLPAHLVIIKNTQRYVQGEFQEYSESNLLQMIGRAGRPQFDTSATVVIMTKAWQKERYEKMIGGTELIESNLHRHLTEHLNAEVVLGVITDIAIALEWIRYSFLYVRVLKNPKYYNFSVELSKEKIEKKLQDMCQIEINALHRHGMLQIDQTDGFSLSPTNMGILMANYYLTFDTMKLFSELKGEESLCEILILITKSKEFSEILLRVNDKKTLNTLNRCKYQNTIRFPVTGNIKTTQMKVNCIIQATFGNLRIQDPALLQESQKILKIGNSVINCLVEYLLHKTNFFSALLNALILSQCFHAKLWENSPYVSKQLNKIGPVLSSMLVTAGKSSFKLILETNPRDLERIINRAPPMGNEIHEAVSHLPFYKIEIEPPVNNDTFCVKIVITLVNAQNILQKNTAGSSSFMNLLVGDSENNVLFYKKIYHSVMAQRKNFTKFVDILIKNNHIIKAFLISENWVGIDCKQKVEIFINNYIKSNSKNYKENVTKTNNEEKVVVSNSSDITKYFKKSKKLDKPQNKEKIKNTKPTDKVLGMKTITSYFSKKNNNENNLEKEVKNSLEAAQKVEIKNPEDLKNIENEEIILPNSIETGYGSYSKNIPIEEPNNISNFHNNSTIYSDYDSYSKNIPNKPTDFIRISQFCPSNFSDIFENEDENCFENENCSEINDFNEINPSNNFTQTENNKLEEFKKNLKYLKISQNENNSQTNFTQNQNNHREKFKDLKNFNSASTEKFTSSQENIVKPNKIAENLQKIEQNAKNNIEVLTSHISKKNFLNTFNNSVHQRPKKEVINYLNQFKYTPQKMSKLPSIKNEKKEKLTEQEKHIFEPEIIIDLMEDNKDTNWQQDSFTCDKLKEPMNKNIDLPNDFNSSNYLEINTPKYNKNNVVSTPSNVLQIKTNNAPTTNAYSKFSVNNSIKNSETVSKLVFADSFREFVEKTVQKLKKETLINQHFNYDIGFEEFLLAPLDNNSLSSNSQIESGESEEEKEKQNSHDSQIYLTNSNVSNFDITFKKIEDTHLQENEVNDITFAAQNETINYPPETNINELSFFKPENYDFIQETEHSQKSLNSSEESTDEKKMLRIENKLKVMEQWHNSQAFQKSLNSESQYDKINFDFSNREQNSKKIKLTSPYRINKTEYSFNSKYNPSATNESKLDILKNMPTLKKILTKYGNNLENKITLPNKKEDTYSSPCFSKPKLTSSNNEKKSILTKAAYSYMIKDKDTIQMSVTVFEKESKIYKNPIFDESNLTFYEEEKQEPPQKQMNTDYAAMFDFNRENDLNDITFCNEGFTFKPIIKSENNVEQKENDNNVNVTFDLNADKTISLLEGNYNYKPTRKKRSAAENLFYKPFFRNT